MDFVCLAAGRGTRLGNLGSYLQKCMYPVGLKPFLEHTLEQLTSVRGGEVGNDRLALVVGHHASQVHDYFGSSFEGLTIEYVEQREQRGTGHALSLARAALQPSSSVIAWQADLFVPAAIFSELARHERDTVVTLGPGHADEPAVLRATQRGELVARVWEGEGPLFDVGAWKLAPSVLASMGEATAPNGEMRMLLNLQRCIDRGERVGFVESGEWIHLGGTLPSAEENVREVVRRLFEREEDGRGGGRA